MTWIIVASIVVVLGAGASLIGSLDDRRDLATGRPSFDTIASLVGTWDRPTITKYLGEPDRDGRFSVTPEQVRMIPRTWWKRYFDRPWQDGLCMIGAIAAPFLWPVQQPAAIAIAVASLTYVLAGYLLAIVMTVRSGIWKDWLSEPVDLRDASDNAPNEAE